MNVVHVDRRRDLSSEDFHRLYFDTNTPVVLEGAAYQWWPKTQEWNLDYLNSLVGDRECEVRKNTSNDAYRQGKRYLNVKMPFRKYADWHINQHPERYDHYLAVNNIKASLPELHSHIPLPDYVGKLHAGPYLWIATEKHYEYVHTDAHDNFCAVITGRKRFRIFGTCDFHKLYPHALGSKGKTIQGQVDLDTPDFDKFPMFKDAVCMEADVRAGDIVFVPGFFFHQVSSLIPATISVNIFFGTKGDDDYVDKLLTPPRADAFKYWLLNVIVQNKSMPSFETLVEEDLPGSVSNFLFKQFHDKTRPDQVQKMMQWIKEYFSEQGQEYTLEQSEAGKSRKHPRQLKIRGLSWRS